MSVERCVPRYRAPNPKHIRAPSPKQDAATALAHAGGRAPTPFHFISRTIGALGKGRVGSLCVSGHPSAAYGANDSDLLGARNDGATREDAPRGRQTREARAAERRTTQLPVARIASLYSDADARGGRLCSRTSRASRGTQKVSRRAAKPKARSWHSVVAAEGRRIEAFVCKEARRAVLMPSERESPSAGSCRYLYVRPPSAEIGVVTNIRVAGLERDTLQGRAMQCNAVGFVVKAYFTTRYYGGPEKMRTMSKWKRRRPAWDAWTSGVDGGRHGRGKHWVADKL
ncbi:hypothetical protein FB451DRAFT_1371843 [Mycena latifolia]|nr:hypothetical protein FB451DRAFT_1371843 [Mycena latifolia]